MPNTVPLNQLSVAVQNAVQQALGKAGAVPIDRLWVGFVAPENLANEVEVAGKVATTIGREGGVQATGSIGQIQEGGAAQAATRIKIIGLVFKPPAAKQ